MLAFVLPALPHARADDMSIDFFYNNLSGGNWIEVSDYGYGWQPDLAVNDPNWRPYADGYWAYTDDGWTWISYEDFGWATYHYGRWARLADYGWVWFPGSDLDWGPAWVSWRTGGDHVGWAPLPPRGPGVVYEGQPIGAQADIEFDIGPEYYNFIDIRFIGEPVLRDRIFAPSQNVTYINNTVNVTNISVKNNVVYNYGPDYNVLSAHSSRPIQRLSITRQPATNLSAAAKSGALTKVQGGNLIVAAPQKLSKSAPGAAPRSVKAKVAKPKIEKGWAGVPNEAQLKQKIKTENPKNIPPPTGAAAGRAPAGASPAATAPTAGGSPMASPAVTGSPLEKGRHGRPGGRVQPGATGTPGVTGSPMGSPATTGAPFERGNRKGRPGEQPQPSLTGTPARSPAGTASPSIQGSPAGGEHDRPGRGRFETSPTPPHGGRRHTSRPPGNPVRLRLRLRQRSHLARTGDNLNAAFPVRARRNLAALQTRRRKDLEDAGLNKPERRLLLQRAWLLTRAPPVEDSEGRVPMVSAAELPLGGLLLAARQITKNHKVEKRKVRKHLLLLALNNTKLI